MNNEKQFNMYWGNTGRRSVGSPHKGCYVIDELFNGSLSVGDASSIAALEIGETLIDEGGDTWERIA